MIAGVKPAEMSFLKGGGGRKISGVESERKMKEKDVILKSTALNLAVILFRMTQKRFKEDSINTQLRTNQLFFLS